MKLYAGSIQLIIAQYESPTYSQLTNTDNEASIFSMGGICPISFIAVASPAF